MVQTSEPVAPDSHGDSKIALTNVRVFNGQQLSESTTVVIDGGIIGEGVEGAYVIDGQGGILLPGLIDAHVHLQSEHDLRQMSEYGVTTALDMATWPPAKLNALRGRVGMTDIRSPGLPATSPGSIHSLVLPFSNDDLVYGPKDAAKFIADRISEGVDYIKVIADVPGPDQATLNALVTAAHEQKKLVVAHASYFTPFAMAQEAGVDVVTHAPTDKALDRDAVAQMIAGNRVAVPTLTMMEIVIKPPGMGAIARLLLRPSLLFALVKARRNNPNAGNRKYEYARESVTSMYHAGVPILAGTDANMDSGSPFKVKHGDALHRELELLVDAGLSTVDALQAATSLPAKYFGLNDRGVIEVGKRADLVLISGDPLQDIRATRSIRRVWCGGVEIKRL